MNKFLLIIMLILFFLTIFSIKKAENRKEYLDLSSSSEVTNDKIVQKINENSEQIKKIYAELTIEQFPILLKGFIAYEKDNNFKMTCSSILRKEIEIGSNNNFFWFWSNHMKPKALYYCDYDKIEKTRLRKIFYPKLLKTFLGIDKLNNYEIRKKDDFLYVLENFIVSNEKLIKVTIIKEGKIIAYKLCKDNEILLEVEIIEFKENLPQKIKINWIEEKIEQQWILSNIKINNDYDDWQMPEYKQKINLENY
jgi:hypothetical protein